MIFCKWLVTLRVSGKPSDMYTLRLAVIEVAERES